MSRLAGRVIARRKSRGEMANAQRTSGAAMLPRRRKEGEQAERQEPAAACRRRRDEELPRMMDRVIKVMI